MGLRYDETTGKQPRHIKTFHVFRIEAMKTFSKLSKSSLSYVGDHFLLFQSVGHRQAQNLGSKSGSRGIVFHTKRRIKFFFAKMAIEKNFGHDQQKDQ